MASSGQQTGNASGTASAQKGQKDLTEAEVQGYKDLSHDNMESAIGC